MIYYFLILLIAWELYWKFKSLWLCANRGHKKWFLSILLINSLGILPIYYLYKQNYFEK